MRCAEFRAPTRSTRDAGTVRKQRCNSPDQRLAMRSPAGLVSGPGRGSSAWSVTGFLDEHRILRVTESARQSDHRMYARSGAGEGRNKLSCRLTAVGSLALIKRQHGEDGTLRRAGHARRRR